MRPDGWRCGREASPTRLVKHAVTFFDTAGDHAPDDDIDGWNPNVTALDRDRPTLDALARYGIPVTRTPSQP